MAFVEHVRWNHLFVGTVPTHHAIGAPAFVGHVDSDHAGESQFDRAVERLAIADMVVQIRMVKILIFATGFLVLTEDLSIGVLGNPAIVVEEKRSAVTSDQVVDADPVPHGTEYVNRHAPRVFTNHFDVVRQVPSIWPLPNTTHADDSAWEEEIASTHDSGDAVDEQVGADAA